VVKSRDEDVLESSKPTPKPKAAPTTPTPTRVIESKPSIPSTPTTTTTTTTNTTNTTNTTTPTTGASALERDAVLDNDLISGKSFFDERVKDNYESVSLAGGISCFLNVCNYVFLIIVFV
jgi:hypothetical protein